VTNAYVIYAEILVRQIAYHLHIFAV